jgi:hypothetical protein
MDDFKEIGNLPQPKLGKFGEFLTKRYWLENGLDVERCHRNEIDFYVNKNPYDVKTTATALRKGKRYSNKPPKIFGRCKDGVSILRVAIYTDCAVLASNGECLQQLDRNKLIACWREFHSTNGGCDHTRGAPSEFSNWLKQQKQLVRDICELNKLRVRVMYRNGVANQENWGKWGPNSLIPTDPQKEDLTVFLWTDDKSVHRVIVFLHSDIKNLPLHEYTPPNKEPRQTMNIVEFEQFVGQWCFVSLEDFKKNFCFKH